MPDVFVKSFEHLRGRPKADQALPLLQRIASLVKPIMRKHGWVLPVLAEFFPENPSLLGLNINAGEKILVRLRPAHSPDTFYDEGSLVRTMLHELTHNVNGPHDEKFYSFLSKLEDEFETLTRSGYDGEGFHTKGKRVGTNVSHDVPPHLARQKALEAAEKRRRVNLILGSGGRLGGSGVRSAKSPRELAVEAAERRARDEKACATGEVAQQEAEKASKESVKDNVIDLTGDSDSEPEVILVDPIPTTTVVLGQQRRASGSVVSAGPGDAHAARTRGRSKGAKSRSRTPPPTPPTVDISSPPLSRSAIPEGDELWTCPRCTLINNTLGLRCTACLLTRPSALAPSSLDGWGCLICGETGNPHDFWSCRFCGTIKAQS